MLDPQIQDNIRWHQAEAPFYDSLSTVFNLREQHYLKQQIIKISKQETLPALDFGSGTGNVVKYLEKADLETVAMDISVEMLKQNPAPNKIIAESQYLPFKDGSFGMITACSVLHHLPNPVTTVEEMCRVAAPCCVVLIPHEPVAGLKAPLYSRLTYKAL
ncbi:class I SAM-dependent methyltransferase [Chloroflexota bacterium]